MLCYQVTARFTFHQQKPVLVSTIPKSRTPRRFLSDPRLPFGHRLNVCRFSKKESAQYVSYLHTVYKNRMISNTAAVSSGQLSLF
jgi:hypothetical protein